MATRKLTVPAVEAATTTRGRAQEFLWDKSTPGLGLRVTATGKKSFVYRVLVGGVDRRVTLGTWPDLDLAGARVKAAELRASIEAGEAEPAEVGRTSAGRTLADLWTKFRDEYLPRRSRGHARNCAIAFESILIPALGADTPLASLSWEMIDKWHQSMRESRPVAADRALAALRKAINESRKWDERDGWPGRTWSNPAAEHELHGGAERGRAWSDAELKAIGKAVAAEPDPIQRAALSVYLISGLRPDEVCRMRWRDLGADGRLDLPTSKTGARVAVLSTRAERIIAKLPRVSEFVFPGRNVDQPLGGAASFEHGLSTAWRRVQESAGPLRCYDGRHTWISTASALGIGDDLRRLLAGHAKAGGAHGVYLHVLPEHRKAANRVADALGRKLGLA